MAGGFGIGHVFYSRADVVDSDSNIVQLGQGHAEEIHRLERECFASPWSLKQIEAILGMDWSLFLGLEHRSSLVAYVSMYQLDEEIEILNLAVSRRWRRRGLGRRLLESVLIKARETGMMKIFLEVRESNTPARNLYSSAGFQIVGRRRRYYPDNGEDALVMILELAGSM